MQSRIATIARYTLIEAVRTRLALLMLALIGVVLGASFFVREIAITESARFQTVFYAAAVRFGAVFVTALHVIASVSRDFHDKVLDVALALDLPRSHYIVGKLTGFLIVAAVLSVAVSVPLVALAGWQDTAIWGASLAFELGVIAALSVFCVVTFNQIMPAASVVAAFYLLARSITAIRQIGANPIADATALSHQVMGGLVEALAYVIPALDTWTRTTWLVDERAPWLVLGPITAHSVLFIVIFAAAAVFDMQRRNF